MPVLLASFGLASFGGAGAAPVLVLAGGGVLAGIIVLQSKGLTDLALGLAMKLPVGDRIVPKVREAVDASRALLAWKPLEGLDLPEPRANPVAASMADSD